MLKQITVIIVLSVLTFGIVLSPWLLNKYSDSNLTEKVIYWQHNAEGSRKITGKQVAQLYKNGEINIGYFGPFPLESEKSDIATANSDYKEMLKFVFGDGVVLENINSIVLSGAVSYSYNSVLTMIDGHPISLNFVGVCIKGAESVIEFVYEEKTKTLISIAYGAVAFSSESEGYTFLDEFISKMNNYCKTQLELDEWEYHISPKTFDTDTSDNKYFYIDYSILQFNNYGEKDEVIIYN